MKYNGLSEPKARHAIPDDSVQGGSSLPLTESSILIKSEQHRHRQVIRCCADAKEKDPTWWSDEVYCSPKYCRSLMPSRVVTAKLPQQQYPMRLSEVRHGHQKHGTKFPWVENPPMGILCLRLSCPQAFRGQRWCWDIIRVENLQSSFTCRRAICEIQDCYVRAQWVGWTREKLGLDLQLALKTWSSRVDCALWRTSFYRALEGIHLWECRVPPREPVFSISVKS